MKSFLDKITMTVISYMGYIFIRFLEKTMKISYVNCENIWKDWQNEKKTISAFWHGRLMMMPLMYKGNGITVLVSQHKDGELVSRTMKGFNIDSVRGSSTRGWFGGVKELLKNARKGRDLAITPDGPKGPRYKAQLGIINIAKITGLPIIPMTFSASKKKL